MLLISAPQDRFTFVGRKSEASSDMDNPTYIYSS